MDLVTVSLEALLQRACNPANENLDIAAIDAFSALINKEPNGSTVAARLLAQKIQSKQEKEALQALTVLDNCMKNCHNAFRLEIAKFRFLNEMIKIVSPKYLGNSTDPAVQSKVILLLHAWSCEYPKETKIKEAYDMLKKQGVAPSLLPTSHQNCEPKTHANIFEDSEKTKLLKKLLKSKNPDDLQAANKLIKTMVKEVDKDERRVEINSRRSYLIQTIHNNVRLLDEMLDSYRANRTSHSEIEIIQEVYQNCERLKANLPLTCIQDTELLEATVALDDVFDRYKNIFIDGNELDNSISSECLLELKNHQNSQEISLLSWDNDKSNDTSKAKCSSTSAIDEIRSLFCAPLIPNKNETASNIEFVDILKPDIKQEQKGVVISDVDEQLQKHNDFGNLDILSESLMKQNLNEFEQNESHIKKFNEKIIPMNKLKNSSDLINSFSSSTSLKNGDNQLLNLVEIIANNENLESKQNLDKINNLDLLYLESKLTDDAMLDLGNLDIQLLDSNNMDCKQNLKDRINSEKEIHHHDDGDIEVSKMIKNNSITKENDPPTVTSPTYDIKPLTDIVVQLEAITPSDHAPLNVICDKNNITVALHFTNDKPRDDVSVIVILTTSKSKSNLTNYLFQAVVPKTCKLKLQPPSSTELPSYNPFLPSTSISQIMLIANPNKMSISLKFIISYTMNDELFTEMGEIDQLHCH